MFIQSTEVTIIQKYILDAILANITKPEGFYW